MYVLTSQLIKLEQKLDFVRDCVSFPYDCPDGSMCEQTAAGPSIVVASALPREEEDPPLVVICPL
jgi:hypothetical protein